MTDLALFRNIEPFLFVLELVLLIATVTLLLMSRKEWRGREELLSLLATAVRTLSREEYFRLVIETLQNAKDVRAIVTGTRPTEASERYVNEILNIMSKNNEGNFKYLLIKSPEKLEMGSRYAKSGAEVRFHEGLVVYDFRFMLVDESYAVLGLPERVGESQPTRRGIKLESETLTKILLDYFNDYWKAAETYEKYASQVVSNLVEKNPNVSARTIAQQLNLDIEEVKRIYNKLYGR